MKKLLYILLSFCCSQVFAQDCSDIFISEYVEGTSNNKAIELYNPTNQPIHLSQYSLSRWSNGNTTPSTTQLSGIVDAKSTYVIVYDKRDPNGEGFDTPVWYGYWNPVDQLNTDTVYDFSEDLQSLADTFINPDYTVSNTMAFNGNDAITLEKGSDIIDIFGKVGENPGEAWGDENGAWWTKDQTLIRKSSVMGGFVYNPTEAYSFDPSIEWDSLPMNTFTELGQHVCDCSIISGCTDENADNFNQYATINDGSCNYYMLNDMTLDVLEENVFNDYPDAYAYFSYLIDSLSNQIQDLQEALISETLDDEIVSDANSFDVLNPLSYNGDFETISIEALEEFIVPSGKTLLINFANLSALVNDIPLFQNSTFPGVEPIVYPGKIFNVPIVVSENNVVTGTVLGLLINKSYSSVHYYNDIGDTINSLNFTVPDNQTLVITNLLGAIAVPYLIDGVTVGYVSENNNILYSNNSISVPSDFSHTQAGFHGFLIDNSNYTYATDYELIDALNEGMDSLSTMSEIVLLENDSIISQNAILTEENEALMAIDYNFDSLQYVADFLSSQVFDLQQELLIPNIDVDMAIGWNMIGFSCPELNSAENALSDIVEELIILKDNNGLVYLPEWNFNGIGDLTPGHGYQLKVIDYILDFNICD